MYYNFKPVNDENTCIQCFAGDTFTALFCRLLEFYDVLLHEYLGANADICKNMFLTKDECVRRYVFTKALPKSFRKLWKAKTEGECVLKAKDCMKLMKVLANYDWHTDFDAECLYSALEWALYNKVDICVKASDTPFK